MDKLLVAIATIFGGVILFLIGVTVFGLILSVPMWLLWNWVAVAVFGFKVITLLQALGLTLLSGLIFGRSVTKS